mmetsp:Transcript_24919/g.63207  ORF Transcript_24919/g.63207 Transcript_24919/m.63207 type:complete len:213 (-) Transcript_24919:432-1070(-)
MLGQGQRLMKQTSPWCILSEFRNRSSAMVRISTCGGGRRLRAPCDNGRLSVGGALPQLPMSWALRGCAVAAPIESGESALAAATSGSTTGAEALRRMPLLGRWPPLKGLGSTSSSDAGPDAAGGSLDSCAWAWALAAATAWTAIPTAATPLVIPEDAWPEAFGLPPKRPLEAPSPPPPFLTKPRSTTGFFGFFGFGGSFGRSFSCKSFSSPG